MIEYREYAPPPDLADAVRCIWFLVQTPGTPTPQRILPDGCVELVFNFADRFEDLGSGAARTQPAQLVVGPLSRHMLIRPTGSVDLAGIRFLPGGAAVFIAGRMSELGDRTASLDETAHRLDETLWERAADGTRAARYDVILAGLRRARRGHAPDPRAIAACRAVAASNGRIPVHHLARAAGTTPRTLERLFDLHVGMPPKRLARLARFQGVLRSASTLTGTGRLRAAAFSAGYFDQAHFLREFRAFAGVSPSTFFGGEDNAMSHAFTAPADP